MTRYYLVGQAPFRDKPAGKLLGYIPAYTIINEILDRQDAMWNGEIITWCRAEYRNQTGWFYENYSEEYIEKYPYEVEITIPTPNPSDAEQYILCENHVKYNMCGEFCCAYIVDAEIKSLLDKWKVEYPKEYERIYKGILDKGTGLVDLDTILKMYGCDYPSLRLYNELVDPVRNVPVFTTGRMKYFADRYQIIIGCKISSNTGRLQPSGILHWVVVESVEPDRIYGGLVHLYNPFCNRKEDYSWNEFKTSVGSPNGLLVKR